MDEPSQEDTDLLAELLRIGAVVLPTHHPGWEHSQIDGQQREYILDREAVIEAGNRLRKVPWQNVDCANKSLAIAIIENMRHSLGVMETAMRENERKMLG